MQRSIAVLSFSILAAMTIAACGTDAESTTDVASTDETETVTDLALSTMPAGQTSDQLMMFENWVGTGSRSVKRLFVSRIDGTHQRPLLATPVDTNINVLHGNWSPDGRWVAFDMLERDGDNPSSSVWIVAADGSNPQQVAACESAPCSQYAYPSWSPDGSELAMIRLSLYSDESCCTSDLVVVDISMSEAGDWVVSDEQIPASFTESDAVDTYDSFHGPDWSSDGTRIAYTVEQYGFDDPYPLLGTRVAVVSRSGGDAHFITPLELQAANPNWHPCHDLIAFTTNPLSQFQESSAPGNIYTVRPDGTDIAQITDESVDGSLRFGGPLWAPDGSAFNTTVARASNGRNLDSIELATVPSDGGPMKLLGIYGAGGMIRPSAGASCDG